MSASTRRRGPDLGDLVEDWLTAKRATQRADDPGHSDRARRTDLRRWGHAIATVQGRNDPTDADTAGVDPWRNITLADVNTDTLLRALAHLGDEGLADTTRRRLLAHLRGWSKWLTTRGHLTSDPTAADELRVRSTGRDLDGKSFTDDEIGDLIASATNPPAGARSAWPSRDVAVILTLARCGIRASELCGLEVRSIDRDREVPVVRIRAGSKGGGRRDVPLPVPVVKAIDQYLAERGDSGSGLRDPLFVRRDGAAFTQPTLDGLLRRLCQRAGVDSPTGAMAHAFRHYCGTQLALRGVPVPIIQQVLGHADPRTTSIYTRASGVDLALVLNEAGWL